MDIAGYISELLEHQDQLSVPGLGTFYRSRLDGYYNKDQQQFYPPSLQLRFNQELQTDDGKLIAAMTADRQTTAASARYYLDKFVENLLQHAANETVTFGDLGTFSMRRNQLLFMPKKLNNNNELFYGLAPVRLRRNRAELEGRKAKPVVQMPYTEKPSAFTAALLRGEPMPGKPLSAVNGKVEEEPEDVAEGKKTVGINTWVLIVAIFILVTGVGLILAYKMNPDLFDRFRGQNEPPPITNTQKASRRTSDSIQHALQAQKDIGLSPKTDSATQSQIVGPEAPRDTFGLVISTHATLEGAKKLYDRYSYTGLPVEIRKKPNDPENRYQILVNSYYSIDSAKKYIDGYKVKLKLPNITIETYPYKKQ